jgi:hypothetical protein
MNFPSSLLYVGCNILNLGWTLLTCLSKKTIEGSPVDVGKTSGSIDIVLVAVAVCTLNALELSLIAMVGVSSM